MNEIKNDRIHRFYQRIRGMRDRAAEKEEELRGIPKSMWKEFQPIKETLDLCLSEVRSTWNDEDFTF